MIEKIGIGLISPSAPAPALFPERFKRGVKFFESLGFIVKCGKHVLDKDGMTSASARERADDINSLIVDPEVSILMATIGGDYSAEILPYLDWKCIQENKKSLIGYSDITVLLHAIGIKTKQVVFYGPTLMTEFSEYPIPPNMSKESFLKIFDNREDIVISSSEFLLEKGPDWGLPPIERNHFCPVFPKTIRSGHTSGIVLGGCIESLGRLRGTEFWPDFKDAILLMETSDDEFDEKKWRCLIADFVNIGVFKKIVGIVIGQKMWSKDEIERLSLMLLDATSDTNIPILYGLPFGHISPIATLPLFTTATLDADNMKLTYDRPFKYEYTME